MAKPTVAELRQYAKEETELSAREEFIVEVADEWEATLQEVDRLRKMLDELGVNYA